MADTGFLTLTEAAKRLGTSRRTLSRRITDGEIPAHREGTRVSVATTVVDRILEARTEHLRDAEQWTP